MGFSDYHPSHPNHDKTNEKLLGKFKDERNGKIITSFIGLKPKPYCYKVYSEEEEEEHKKSNEVYGQLSYKEYEETLNTELKEKVT